MNLLQALRYFAHEAMLSAVRSWKVSLLAVVTIAVSLFVSGTLLLVSTNLTRLLGQWSSQAKVVIYLEPAAAATEIETFADQLAARPWVTGVETVSAEAARARFESAFPSLKDVVSTDGWETEPLPASLEVAFDSQQVSETQLVTWLEELRQNPAAQMVDDDRDWLAQLETLVAVLRGIGFALGGVLLGAAIFTIASVIRLIAYLYHEEISIMRIIGATEFFIRGPFYFEGLLQGLAGGLLALLTLHAGHYLALNQQDLSVWSSALIESGLRPSHQVLLVLLGAGAGLFGAIVSLRRESLGDPAEEPADN